MNGVQGSIGYRRLGILNRSGSPKAKVDSKHFRLVFPALGKAQLVLNTRFPDKNISRCFGFVYRKSHFSTTNEHGGDLRATSFQNILMVYTHCTTEPQRTGGPGAEQLDGLQSNRLDPSVSTRDERPEPLREGCGLDLCSARGGTTRGT